jgi:hypothetical protein
MALIIPIVLVYLSILSGMSASSMILFSQDMKIYLPF